jgi:hypothetical protein
MKNILTLLFVLAFFTNVLTAQNVTRHRLAWTNPKSVEQSDGTTRDYLSFDEAQILGRASGNLPHFTHRFPLGASDARLNVQLQNEVYAPLEITPNFDKTTLSLVENQVKITAFSSKDRTDFWGNVQILPIRKVGTNYEKLISFDLLVNNSPIPSGSFFRGDFARNSNLKDGDIYKISIRETGVQKLDYNFLKNDLKISNLDQIDPRTIKILGNGGGMLPERNDANRLDDVQENAIEIVGANDGRFDPSDYILFYAIAADRVQIWDSVQQLFHRPKNIYSNESFYFLKISSGNGLRVAEKASANGATYTTTTFSDFGRIEDDKYNLLYYNRTNSSSGSGKTWLGDIFNNGTPTRNYTLQTPNLVASEPVRLQVNVATAAEIFPSFTIRVANQNFTLSTGRSYPNATDSQYADFGSLSETFLSSATDSLTIGMTYNGGGYDGWLDFLQINYRRKLALPSDRQMAFRDFRTQNQDISTFRLSGNTGGWSFWDITTPTRAANQNFETSGNEAVFSTATRGQLREFVAFKKDFALLKPVAAGKIENQNLHALDNVDFVFVYHKNFEASAQKLAAHRRQRSQMTGEAVDVAKIYNEFSSGAGDLAAIRDFARMLHERSPRFKHLLLVGDGTFDARGIYPVGLQQASNFLPAYETDESSYSIDAYPADDFFGLLSPNEGNGIGRSNGGDLDISVGRLPCKTSQEAEEMVSKIIYYDTNPVTLGSWRNKTVFMADDEDNGTHFYDAEPSVNIVENRYKIFNIDKLYVDAYRKEISAGGVRVPDLNNALFNNQFQGMLTLAYLGHGGPKGLAQERILMREDLESWQNKTHMPLLITATCTFAPYDNPKEVAAGEAAILNPNGGAIGLFSTTRPVYAGAGNNQTLTKVIFENVFKKEDGKLLTIGEAFRRGKNGSATGVNGQKFTLLGDPTMRLAIPKYHVAVAKINNKTTDTIRALQRITVEGTIAPNDSTPSILENFNGTLLVTVFDKAVRARTLGQSGNSPIVEYRLQRNVIFKGAATVRNGRWKFDFVVPRDINYDFGSGKMSFYAHDGVSEDANGYFDGFIIGGTSTNITDNQPPKVEVFMNNENFVYGGMTDENPVLLAKISDDNGINISGTAIGHDLAGNIDESTQTIALNNFYEAVINESNRGIVRYPLKNMTEGVHTIKVKAWDIANNSGEGMTQFVVAKSGKAALAHVLNYPNPFSTRTAFQFEYNLATRNVRVQVQIFSISGRLVKTIDQDVLSEGYRVNNVEWDGKDDFGSDLARGVYLYKVKIKNLDSKSNESAESDFEKLVIIK